LIVLVESHLEGWGLDVTQAWDESIEKSLCINLFPLSLQWFYYKYVKYFHWSLRQKNLSQKHLKLNSFIKVFPSKQSFFKTELWTMILIWYIFSFSLSKKKIIMVTTMVIMVMVVVVFMAMMIMMIFYDVINSIFYIFDFSTLLIF